jgi:hypothetical protein
MGFRITTRKLTGRLHGLAGDGPDVRAGQHEKGRPAVTIDLLGFNQSRTFDDPEQLDKFMYDIKAARDWLREQVKQ